MNIDFDWDPSKAAPNAKKHGIAYEDAMLVFADPLARSILDRSPEIAEERWVTIGESRLGVLLVVVPTYIDIDETHALVRLISARRATRNRGAAVPRRRLGMKDEYDFSSAQRGRFYRPGANLVPPLHLDPDVLTALTKRAEAGKNFVERAC